MLNSIIIRASKVLAVGAPLLDAYANIRRRDAYKRLEESYNRFTAKLDVLEEVKKTDKEILALLNQNQGFLKIQTMVETLWILQLKALSRASSAAAADDDDDDEDDGYGDDGGIFANF